MLEFVECKNEFCNIIHGTKTSKVAFEKTVEFHAEFLYGNQLRKQNNLHLVFLCHDKWPFPWLIAITFFKI